MKREETVRVVNLATGYTGKKGPIVVTPHIEAALYSTELTCLLGPNGAGKSTLLKTLTAFQPPVKGEIYIESKLLSDYTDAELSKVIGVVLTERLNVNNMTVDELVGLGRSPYTGFWGHMSEYDRCIVKDAINLVGIESLQGRMVQTLSDGERQKVMIAKALAQETPIIFLDEPTAFLDYPSKVEIMQLLQQLARERDKTVFLSTHDLELALQIADKVWLLDKPHGVTIGTPEDLALKGELNKYFHREGVRFDLESGGFKIDHKLLHAVYLEGEGPHASMARKALARRGIATTEHKEGYNVIVAEASGYRLNGKVCKDIGRLLDEVDLLFDN